MVALALVAVATTIVGLWTLRAPVEAREEAVSGPVQVMETKEMMKILMDPLWEDIRDLTEKEPKLRRDWRSLYIATFSLAEDHNLLFNRQGSDYHQTEEWKKFSIDGLKASIALAESVRDQNFEAVLENKTKVMNTCNACHQQFEPMEAPTIEP